MNRSHLILRIILATTILELSTSVRADPCGMVPPIYLREEGALVRTGVQKTYVFYKNGIETFVIHPGFQGKVAEFGMLIPFPTPPAIRKIPDNIFPQIAAAVDPPEVIIDLTPRIYGGFGAGGFGGGGIGGGGGFGGGGFMLKKDEVRVIREEAVGMYETAVIAAGSAAALKRWMNDHKFKYPEGMDDACEDYVEEGWCFVAVKAKVGPKAGIDPKPGMRKVNAELPDGAGFDGYVQAMGFRFYSRELVVPMRLSAFNKGELRNIVYLLTDHPSAIESLPTKFVVRQISGEVIFRNLTEPLPIRVIGAKSVEDRHAILLDGRRVSLPSYVNRDPKPKNGLARELFASDISAVLSRRLALPFEKSQNELLQISERLLMRGPEIDQLHRKRLVVGRKQTERRNLRYLNELTLTVIDGDFPRDVISKQNLTFVKYSMPANRNSSKFYDANAEGPPPEKKGILKVSAVIHSKSALALKKPERNRTFEAESFFSPWTLGTSLSVFFLAMTVVFRFRQVGLNKSRTARG